jgi:hypothetical protein
MLELAPPLSVPPEPPSTADAAPLALALPESPPVGLVPPVPPVPLVPPAFEPPPPSVPFPQAPPSAAPPTTSTLNNRSTRIATLP